jgi:hypothetical protein
MKKASRQSLDELRPEYDLASLGPGVRGKYAERLKGTTPGSLFDARSYRINSGASTSVIVERSLMRT